MYHNYLILKSKAMKKQMNASDSHRDYRDPGCGCGSGCCGGLID
jgi:hypothetical protein